jgi:hypothetical protein
MGKSKITAEWARKESTNILTEKIQKQIEFIENRIVEATKDNKFTINVLTSVDGLTLKEFEDRGFKVERYSGGQDPRESSYTTLSW